MTIRLPASPKTKLATVAKRLGNSPEQFVRETLLATLQAPTPIPGPSRHEQCRDLCGSMNGGPSDLARDRKHLKGYCSWKR